MIFEDAHWTDPTSLELVGRIVNRIATLIGQPHVTSLTINRLTQRNVGAMIDRLVGNKPLGAGLRQDIIERTDGIPLFVEVTAMPVLLGKSYFRISGQAPDQQRRPTSIGLYSGGERG
jgi:hypothetical protein